MKFGLIIKWMGTFFFFFQAEDGIRDLTVTGVQTCALPISPAVDGYLQQVGDGDATRRGNVMARERMIVLFDLSAKHKALPIGTSNKSERLLGSFTWHSDDTPPDNPLVHLCNTQLRALARQT